MVLEKLVNNLEESISYKMKQIQMDYFKDLK